MTDLTQRYRDWDGLGDIRKEQGRPIHRPPSAVDFHGDWFMGYIYVPTGVMIKGALYALVKLSCTLAAIKHIMRGYRPCPPGAAKQGGGPLLCTRNHNALDDHNINAVSCPVKYKHH